MASTHNILVCTEDAVLAKKVRILLAREECEVEILTNPRRLDRRLLADRVSLLVLSGRLANEDAVSVVSRLAQSTRMPPTIVIGGQVSNPPEFVQVVTDPADTQAIYRLASEALANNGVDPEDATMPPFDGLGSESGHKTQKMKQLRSSPRDPTAKSSEPLDIDLSEMELPTGEEIGARLTSAASNEEETFDPLASPPRVEPRPSGEAVEDITVFDVASYHASSTRGDNLGLAGVLEPPRFAKVLFQCWTMEAQGALVIATADETVTVSFEDGLPIHVESNIHGDLFGKNLVAKGKLTEAQYGDAAKLAIERGLSIGGAIVELGYLNRDSYGRELGEDAHDRLVRRFASRGGAFEFIPNRKSPIADRPYRISVGRIMVEGLKRFADDQALGEICGDIEQRYFKLRSTLDELTKKFPLTDKEKSLLTFSGRAYNVADAAEQCGLDGRGARVLMALLITCDEFDDFTPGVAEFESRIREERQRQSEAVKGARSDLPGGARFSDPPRLSVPAAQPASPPPTPLGDFLAAVGGPSPSFPPPASTAKMPPPPPAAFVAPVASSMPAASSHPIEGSQRPSEDGHAAIPPMPTPANGQSGRTPRPVVFSPPLPRGPDGQPQETPERTRSRQHFQRGVTLLGQGNFDDAEEAFRDAIALCSEEHVYLIGLARALYYNPSYSATGKVPVLRTIVDRAAHLAPDDGRVLTLNDWVKHAETQLR